MKVILKDNNTYILSCARDEEIMSELKKFAEKNNIKAASFSIIGASKEVELAWYDVDIKEYTTKVFKEKLEILSMLGSIGIMNGDIIVHSHGVFSNKKMQTMGGHVNKVVVAAACEIILQKLKGTIKREYSKEIGLNLMEE
ncbi:MAG: DNA-binding protein [Patescibacteria group bacterium]|nr:DNA-binding protein [Patescibacteria group bacterium]